MDRLLRISIVGALALALAGTNVATLQGIVNGAPDEGRHPNVGSVCIKLTADGLWSCFPGSATLVSRDVMVSVAHAGPFFDSVKPAAIAFSFEPVHSSEPGDLFGSVRPLHDPTNLVKAYRPHPMWDPTNLSNPLDVGVFVLHRPVRGVQPARLPRPAFLDRVWKRFHPQFRRFTIVGYGVSETDEPLYDSWNERRLARTTGTSLLPGALVTAATRPDEGVGCFGESGSPVFYGPSETIVGVGSYAIGLCEEFAYSRLDTEGALSFLAQFVPVKDHWRSTDD
jgi:hypothetical protein